MGKWRHESEDVRISVNIGLKKINWNIAYMTLMSMMKRKVVFQTTTQGVTEPNPNTQTWGIMTARLNLWFYTVCISKGEEILHSVYFKIWRAVAIVIVVREASVLSQSQWVSHKLGHTEPSYFAIFAFCHIQRYDWVCIWDSVGDKFRNTIAPTQNNSLASIERRESSSFNVNLVQFVLPSSRPTLKLSALSTSNQGSPTIACNS